VGYRDRSAFASGQKAIELLARTEANIVLINKYFSSGFPGVDVQRYSSSAPEPILRFLILSHPEQPGIKSAPVFEIIFESVGESGVHIERGSIIDRGCDHADVELRRHLVGSSVEPAELGADNIAVVIYRRDAAHVASVGDLIAVGVEAVARAAVCNGLLRAADAVHRPENPGDGLTRGVERGLAVHVYFKIVLRPAYRGGERRLLLEKKYEEQRDIGYFVAVFGLGNFNDRLVGCLRHDLVAQIGVGDFGYVRPVAENILRLAHERMDFILISECLFEIHIVHLAVCYADILPHGEDFVIEPVVQNYKIACRIY